MAPSPSEPSPGAPVPGRREQNRAARERAYLDAAMAIAISDGLRELTMTRLAASVDAAVGTVYTYFPSKGALVAELQREAIERLTASYHLVRDRSEVELEGWDDPIAAALARMATFGAFWISTMDTFPQEAALLHGLISESQILVPPEERHRVVPTALALLDEARQVVVVACDVGAIDACEPIELVVRWASALTGVLLTRNIGGGSPIVIEPARLANDLQRELLRGWGATPDALEQAEAHVARLAAGGPLAPPPGDRS